MKYVLRWTRCNHILVIHFHSNLFINHLINRPDPDMDGDNSFNPESFID